MTFKEHQKFCERHQHGKLFEHTCVLYRFLFLSVNREAEKISALSSGKIDKNEYLTGDEILPFSKRKIIEPAKLAYSLLGKAFEKQTKTKLHHSNHFYGLILG